MTEEVTHQSGDTNEDSKLDIDETWIFAATYDIPYEYYDEFVTNNATASGTDVLLREVTAWATFSIENPYYYYLY